MTRCILAALMILVHASLTSAQPQEGSDTVTLTGTIFDVLSDERIEGCIVVASADSIRTDAHGHFEFKLAPDAYMFSVRTWDKNYYGYSTILNLTEDTQLDVPMIPRRVDLKFIKSFFPNDAVVRWERLPVRVYYNRSEAPARYIFMLEEAIADWEFISGLDLFVEVKNREEAGLDIRYVSSLKYSESEIDLHIDSNCLKRMTISIKTYYPWFIFGTKSYAYKAFCHELGHALGLSHSEHGFQIMSSDHQTKWEVTAPLGEVIRVVYTLPVGANLSSYLPDKN